MNLDISQIYQLCQTQLITINIDNTIKISTPNNILKLSQLVDNPNIIFEFDVSKNFNCIFQNITTADFLIKVLEKNNTIYDITSLFFIENLERIDIWPFLRITSFCRIFDKIYESYPQWFHLDDIPEDILCRITQKIIQYDDIYLWWKSKNLRLAYDENILLRINHHTNIFKEILTDIFDSGFCISNISLCRQESVSRYGLDDSIFGNYLFLFQFLKLIEEHGIDRHFNAYDIKLLFMAFDSAHENNDTFAESLFAYYIDMHYVSGMFPIVFGDLHSYNLNIPYIFNYFCKIETKIKLFKYSEYIDLKRFVNNINIIRDYIISGDIYFDKNMEYDIWFYYLSYNLNDLRIFYNFCKEIGCEMTQLQDFNDDNIDEIDLTYRSYTEIYQEIFTENID